MQTALKLAEQVGDAEFKTTIEAKLRLIDPLPNKIFCVGDKLPSFTFNDVADSSSRMAIVGRDATFGSGFFDGIYWVGGILTVQGVKYGPLV